MSCRKTFDASYLSDLTGRISGFLERGPGSLERSRKVLVVSSHGRLWRVGSHGGLSVSLGGGLSVSLGNGIPRRTLGKADFKAVCESFLLVCSR